MNNKIIGFVFSLCRLLWFNLIIYKIYQKQFSMNWLLSYGYNLLLLTIYIVSKRSIYCHNQQYCFQHCRPNLIPIVVTGSGNFNSHWNTIVELWNFTVVEQQLCHQLKLFATSWHMSCDNLVTLLFFYLESYPLFIA